MRLMTPIAGSILARAHPNQRRVAADYIALVIECLKAKGYVCRHFRHERAVRLQLNFAQFRSLIARDLGEYPDPSSAKFMGMERGSVTGEIRV
jgi:hypothetical protein